MILDENNDLHIILWDVSCTVHVKIEPLHISRRHVSTLVVDVFFLLQICTYEGAVFAQMWLFVHLWFLHISRLHSPSYLNN